MKQIMNLYENLSAWWSLLSPAEEYAHEAEVYAEIMQTHCTRTCDNLLELGSGGGSNAFQLKQYVTSMTLTDLSPGMLNESRKLNPECEHILGDMRNIRLEREFDAVMIHDAVSHMNTIEDLKSAVKTAFIHTRTGGAALFIPDAVSESFAESTDSGGHEDKIKDRALRFLEWIMPDRQRSDIYHVYMSYMLRNGQRVSYERDHWVLGLFSITQWVEIIRSAGFIPYVHRTILDPSNRHEYVMFAGEKR